MLGFGADLPQEVVQVLPSDPYQQLELANKIIGFAYSQRVAQIEAEAQTLREAVINSKNSIKSLERRVSLLEEENRELLNKNKQAVEEQHKLQTEKSALIDTVKKLNREVAKLESFKRSLMQHLQDDDEPAKLERSLASVDLSSERLVQDVLQSANKGGAGVHTTATYSARPGPSPAIPSTSGRGGSYGGASPPRGAGGSSSNFASPPGQGATAQGGPLGAAGANGTPSRIDGKEFFRQARARLSYEQFSQFLTSIKELNAGRQSREDTLRRAIDIFGPQHADLYNLFESLLSKHMTGSF